MGLEEAGGKVDRQTMERRSDRHLPYPPLMPTNCRFFLAPFESLLPSFFFMIDFSVLSLLVHTVKKGIEVIEINITHMRTSEREISPHVCLVFHHIYVNLDFGMYI